MKRFLTLLVFVNSILSAHTQSLADSTLIQYCRKVFYETVLPYEAEMNDGTVVVSETKTGVVKALVNFRRHGIDSWSEDTRYDSFVPALNSPLALFLALLDAGADPKEEFYTTGVLLDEQAGVLIRDWSYDYGGVGNITLSQSCQRSRVALVKACEKWFDRSQATAAYHLSHTGILLGDEDESISDYQSYCERYGDVPWQPLALLGDNDNISVISIQMFTSGLANGGKLLMPRLYAEEPYSVIYDTMAKPEYVEIVKESMRDNVVSGLSNKANVEGVDVFGFSNVSDPNGYEQTALFTGFVDKYTITVTINMLQHDEAISIIPQKIAYSIISYITKPGKYSLNDNKGTYKPHVAEK